MEKKRIFVAGAGHIGHTIAHILAQAENYHVVLADLKINPSTREPAKKNIELLEIDISDDKQVSHFVAQNPIDAFVTCLPHFLTIRVAQIAAQHKANYFDLTEDIHASEAVKQLAQGSRQAFASHCGLAPGFINIVAHNLIEQFAEVTEVKLRCGALPQSSSNALQYARTWSTDGLINEYANPCLQLIDGTIVLTLALEDTEELQIDGANYEAFNTSGGIATLVETHKGKVSNMDYKTIRYPGHGEKMRFLMHGLKLDHDRETLKKILENALPTTKEDVIIVYVAVVGKHENTTLRKSFVHKYYPIRLADLDCSAIQATTASSASAVIDIVLSSTGRYQGFVKQEDFTLDQIMSNRFGKYFRTHS